MPKKRKTTKAVPTPSLAELFSHTTKIIQLADVQREMLKQTQELNTLRERLTRLLNRDQLDAAKVAGVEPWDYAVEWISLYAKEIAPSTDGFYLSLTSLKNMARGTSLGR